MKTKIGTILEEELLHKLKERALGEHRAISAILHDAITQYLQNNSKKELRLAAVNRFCSRPFKNLTNSDFQEIMKEDYYDQ
jgi:hypothetical protein